MDLFKKIVHYLSIIFLSPLFYSVMTVCFLYSLTSGIRAVVVPYLEEWYDDLIG